MITKEEYLYYVKKSLDQMVEILDGLGDELANQRPPYPQSNSPYVIVHHALSVMDFWSGQLIAGGTIDRDRETEFSATGKVSDLTERASRVYQRLEGVLQTAETEAPMRGELPPQMVGRPIVANQGTAFFHIYEELSQHLGQLEGGRDAILLESTN